MNRLSSRKLWFGVSLVILGIASIFTGFGDEYMKVFPAFGTIYGAYVGGNVVGKFSKQTK